MRMDRILHLLALGGLAAACTDESTTGGTGPDLDLLSAPAPSVAGSGTGAVYLTSNATGGNAIIAFARASDGRLTAAGTFPTGGTGTGGGLGNQSSLILTQDQRRLYTVNAGSDDISVFEVTSTGLRQIGAPVPSGGDEPISLTVHGDLLYVLNDGGTGNIAGFRIGVNGALSPISGSSRPLSASAPDAAQITFSPDGRILVVTEKATNTITTYVVAPDGTPGDPQGHPSAGQTPFGFNFNQRGDLLVSQAGGGPGGSTATSYRLAGNGDLTAISGAVATTQTAACWIAVSGNGKFAFTTNTGSGTISSLAIGPGAQLTLEEAVAGVTGGGSAPQDADFSTGGGFLYVRNNGSNTVAAFSLGAGGALTHVDDVGPLPAGANGIAAR